MSKPMPAIVTQQGQKSSALDLSEAAIGPDQDDTTKASPDGAFAQLSSPRAAPSISLPHQDANYVTHIALDIGGSLIKLKATATVGGPQAVCRQCSTGAHTLKTHVAAGKLHFVKFETSKMDACLDFIEAKGLHRYRQDGQQDGIMTVMATGGGAYKFAELFRERLGLQIDKVDEIEALVSGCNFLCRAIRHEVFQYENGQTTFVVNQGDSDAMPYLLVNIGSGVSLIKVDADGRYERVSGSSLGGGTFWGLARLLTRAKDFDELLALCARGDNSRVDMLVGDIYGGRDYTAIGLSANTIASSFGKVIGSSRDLEDYEPADMALSVLRMISYNIGQLAYLNAKMHGLTRILFGGFYIRAHPYIMETISFAIRFWSKGEMAAMFLRHEGFLGAVGAFLKVHPMRDTRGREARKVRAHFVERWPMGAPFSGGEVHGPAIRDVGGKIEWVERFVQLGAEVTGDNEEEHDRVARVGWQGVAGGSSGSLGDAMAAAAEVEELVGGPAPSRSHTLHVGTLHYVPQCEPFPLLAEPNSYEPNTFDIVGDPAERAYWCRVLAQQIDDVATKAAMSFEPPHDAPDAASAAQQQAVRRRAAAFARAFSAHLERLQHDPAAYGRLGLAELFELREECLREFGFQDIYKRQKLRETHAALEVLPDLFRELDQLPGQARLLALTEGVLAANIFDWGARACVELYRDGTILEIYRQARTTLSQRPWRVDHFDVFAESWFANDPDASQRTGPLTRSAYRRVMLFVDNAGADVVLGMLPLARELLCNGAQVVMAANSIPAINDVTADELVALLAEVATMDPVIASARETAIALQGAWNGSIPPPPGLPRRVPSSDRLNLLAPAAATAAGSASPSASDAPATQSPPQKAPRPLPTPLPTPDRSMPYATGPALFVVATGSGSPCLDLRRVSDVCADATVGVDLVMIEGMGRSVHTNYNTRMRCDCLKLAMIKNKHVAETLFGGDVYDCVCRFDASDA